MEWSDVALIGLLLVGVWVIIIEPLTSFRLEDGVRLLADLVRAAWRRAAPLVHWLAYDVIVGRERVNDFDAADAGAARQNSANARTDGRTDLADAAESGRSRLQLDRTRQGLIAVLVDSGWTKTEIREVLKGANDVIGAEVDAAIAARAELQETPIAKRPTAAKFQQAQT